MRILVYEFASGGGLVGRDLPASLSREGAAMRAALVHDLAAMRCHQIVTTADSLLRPALPPDVDVAVMPAGDRPREAALDRLIARVEGVWLIAPESDRCLERLAARVERQGRTLLGSGSSAIARASDKARLPERLARVGVSHPVTQVLGPRDHPHRHAHRIGYPIVVKPARGAGSHGVSLAGDAASLDRAVTLARSAARGTILLQQYIAGTAASVSLLADGDRAVPLTLNAQTLGSSPPCAYQGGVTPLDHPLAARAIASAVLACHALPGLRGFVGVDVVLTDSAAVVIEVNPRVTTAYLGVRAALDENVAALALAACGGDLPPTPQAVRQVRFSASGRLVVNGKPRDARRARTRRNVV